MELATLDYWYLAREWQCLLGGRIQKIYLAGSLHSFHIYSQGKNYTLLITPTAAFLTKLKLAYPSTPGGYCMFLRKRLQGGRVKGIGLRNVDRVLAIDVETAEGMLVFIAELVDGLNTLVLKDNVIVSSLQTHSYSERTIRGGVVYVPPPLRPAAWEADSSKAVGKSAGKALAVDFGLGGRYSDEVCARARFPRDRILTEEDLPVLERVLLDLRDHAIAALHTETEALPFAFTSKQGSWQEAPTFNEAVDIVQRTTIEIGTYAAEQTEAVMARSKQEKVLTAQAARLQELENSAAHAKRAGEKIYEHYAVLEQLLSAIRADWKQHTYKEIVLKYAQHPFVRRIDPDGTIEVDL